VSFYDTYPGISNCNLLPAHLLLLSHQFRQLLIRCLFMHFTTTFGPLDLTFAVY